MYSRVEIIPQDNIFEAHVVVEFESEDEANNWAEDFISRGVLLMMDNPFGEQVH